MDNQANLQNSRPQPPHTQHLTPPPQSWLCLSLTVPHEAAETVASFLVELGSTGVIEGERDFTKPASAVTAVQGFFPLTSATDQLCTTLTAYLAGLTETFPTLRDVQVQVTEVSSEAWAHQWHGHFPPLAVGERFLVLPPWETLPATSHRLPLVINPSMAFGTGHHATTQGCLEAIEMLSTTYGPAPTALDVGTGSGILAIALAQLGTPTVWAIDIDPIALAEARANCAANGVATAIQLSDTPVERFSPPVPLLVANLFSSTLVALAADIERLITPNGHAILSGIQLDQEGEVLTAYTPPVWQLVKRYPKDEWVTLVLRFDPHPTQG